MLKMFLNIGAILFLLVHLCSGYVIKGYLDESVLPLSPKELSATTIQLISDSKKGELPFQETSVRAHDGYFVFSNVTRGDYQLILDSVFLDTRENNYKVSINRDKVNVNKVFTGHDYRKDLGPAVEYPIVISPLYRQQYVVPREAFGFSGMLQNPMMLMSIASIVMVFVLPKMMATIGMFFFFLSYFIY